MLRAAQVEEDAQTAADDRWVEGEKAKAEQEWLIKALGEEQSSLLNELTQKTERYEEIRKALLSEVGLDEMPEDDEQLAAVLQSREAVLREFEDRALSADEMKEKNDKTIAELEEQYRTLASESTRFFTESEATMQERQQESDDITNLYKDLLRQKEAAAEHLSLGRQSFDSQREHHREAEIQKAQLEETLEYVTVDRDQEAIRITGELTNQLGDPASGCRVQKMEEVMMLLKAVSINCSADYQFTGEVNQLWSSPEDSLNGFLIAFRYLEDYIYSAYGEQPRGQRWMLSGLHDARYDEVEALLSSVKQLVICYDHMHMSQKRRVYISEDIIRNAAHLRRLAEESSVKFKEMITAREERKAQIELEKQQKIKQALERSRLNSRKKQADRLPARSASAATTTSSKLPRSGSPRLRPHVSN